MKKILFLIFNFLLINALLIGQSKSDYLQKNRYDLRNETIIFPQNDFKIIGFGALHGSRKTEEAEHQLLNSLTQKGQINYYIIETDLSIGHYFNEYLKSGDTVLLKDLVTHYGIRVPQEKTIETYKKWKQLKQLHDNLPKKDRFKVIGIDPIVSYKYTCRQLVDLTNDQASNWRLLQQLKEQFQADTTDFSPYYASFAKLLLQEFVEDYTENAESYHTSISDTTLFHHIINNLKLSFGDYEREKAIYDNYLALSSIYDFENKPQFIRYGIGHLEKSRATFQNYSFFFTRLIENEIYTKDEIITVMGYLTNSEVIWDVLYDDDGNYKSYTTEAGFGISDYWREYFRGVKKLKQNKLSDLTLFQLNTKDSPYQVGKPDLVEIRMLFSASNSKIVKGKPTTDFVDYAILISDSEASQPIDAM